MVSPWMDNGDLRQYMRLHPHVDRWGLVRLPYHLYQVVWPNYIHVVLASC
jgi:hypothetical protein